MLNVICVIKVNHTQSAAEKVPLKLRGEASLRKLHTLKRFVKEGKGVKKKHIKAAQNNNVIHEAIWDVDFKCLSTLSPYFAWHYEKPSCSA